MMNNARYKLYFNRLSPFACRCWIVVNELGLQKTTEFVQVSLPEPEPWYKDISPSGAIPALQVGRGGPIIHDSLNICQYLNEEGADLVPPGRQLLPEDPADRQVMREFLQEADKLITSFDDVLRAPDAIRPERCDTLAKDLRNVDQLMRDQARRNEVCGAFFFGEKFTLADVALVPFVDRYRYSLAAFSNFDVFDHSPRIERMMRNAAQRPAVMPTLQPRNLTIDVYKDAKPAAL